MNRGDNMRFCREADPGGIIMHAPMPRLFFLKGKSHLPSSVQQESSGAKVAAPRSSLQFIRCDIKNIIRIFISVVIPEGHRTKGAFPVGAFQSVPVNIAPRVGEFQVPVIMFGILPVLAKLYMEAVVQKACGGDGESLRHGPSFRAGARGPRHLPCEWICSSCPHKTIHGSDGILRPAGRAGCSSPAKEPARRWSVPITADPRRG